MLNRNWFDFDQLTANSKLIRTAEIRIAGTEKKRAADAADVSVKWEQSSEEPVIQSRSEKFVAPFPAF